MALSLAVKTCAVRTTSSKMLETIMHICILCSKYLIMDTAHLEITKVPIVLSIKFNNLYCMAGNF